jgi:hypothetical protein
MRGTPNSPLQLVEPSRPRNRRINAGEILNRSKGTQRRQANILRLAALSF